MPPEVSQAAKSLAQRHQALKAEHRAKQAAAEAATRPAPVAEAKPDPDVEAVARILEEDKRVKAERKAVETERQRVAAEKAAIEAEKAQAGEELKQTQAFKAAKASKDPIAMMRALGMTDAEIFEGDDGLMFKLAEARSKKPGASTADQVEAIVAKKLDEKAAADKKAQEDRDAATRADIEKSVAGAKSAFARNVVDIAAKSPEKYPHLVALEVKASVVANYAWQVLANSKGKTELTEAQALQELEEFYAKKVEKARPADAAPARPSLTITPGMQQRTGTPAAEQPKTLKGKFEALKVGLREKISRQATK